MRRRACKVIQHHAPGNSGARVRTHLAERRIPRDDRTVTCEASGGRAASRFRRSDSNGNRSAENRKLLLKNNNLQNYHPPTSSAIRPLCAPFHKHSADLTNSSTSVADPHQLPPMRLHAPSVDAATFGVFVGTNVGIRGTKATGPQSRTPPTGAARGGHAAGSTTMQVKRHSVPAPRCGMDRGIASARNRIMSLISLFYNHNRSPSPAPNPAFLTVSIPRHQRDRVRPPSAAPSRT